jgi:hypothetical protein
LSKFFAELLSAKEFLKMWQVNLASIQKVFVNLALATHKIRGLDIETEVIGITKIRLNRVGSEVGRTASLSLSVVLKATKKYISCLISPKSILELIFKVLNSSAYTSNPS